MNIEPIASTLEGLDNEMVAAHEMLQLSAAGWAIVFFAKPVKDADMPKRMPARQDGEYLVVFVCSLSDCKLRAADHTFH
jgi:hypothetical protein